MQVVSPLHKPEQRQDCSAHIGRLQMCLQLTQVCVEPINPCRVTKLIRNIFIFQRPRTYTAYSICCINIVATDTAALATSADRASACILLTKILKLLHYKG